MIPMFLFSWFIQPIFVSFSAPQETTMKTSLLGEHSIILKATVMFGPV